MLKLLEQWGISQNVLVAALVAILALIGLLLLRRIGRRRPVKAPPVDLLIDVAKLGSQGPPVTGPRLEIYNVPVRLAAVVFAPVGLTDELPINATQPEFADAIVPGLAQVIAAHRPLVRRWPPQVSWQGFSNTFFANARLPGDKGKGSPWCVVAGKFEAGGKKYLAGFALCAAAPNSLAHFFVEREGRWLDLLRVKTQ